MTRKGKRKRRNDTVGGDKNDVDNKREIGEWEDETGKRNLR